MFNLFRKDLKGDIEDLQIEFRDLNELVYRLSQKVDNLFKRDSYDTLRPKIDILCDNYNKFQDDVWESLGKLQERIEKLEKTEVDDLSEKTER